MKLLLGLFFAVILLQVSSIHAVSDDEELSLITIDFVTGDVIDLNDLPQVIRADVKIEDYDASHGYYYMQIIRISDREVLKESLIYPKVIEDNLYGVQISHYVEPDVDEDLIGDYVLRIYSDEGPSEGYMRFYIVKPSIPTDTENIAEETKVENLDTPVSKIPPWVHDIFVWYAEEIISEAELLTALEYLISQDIIRVNSK